MSRDAADLGAEPTRCAERGECSRLGRVWAFKLAGTLGCVAAAAILATGCSISPKPEPPAPGIDLDLVTTIQFDGPVRISGGPGSANPPGAVLRAFNLETQDDPAEGVVGEDGSFAIELEATEGDELRLQLHAEGARSAPVDVVVGPDSTSPALAERALGLCLFLEPPAEVEAAVSSSVRVVNHCADAVTITPSLRRPMAGLSIGDGGSWPFVLGSEASIDVAVRFDGAPGALEEIAFIEATLPQRDRRPLTVWPTSP